MGMLDGALLAQLDISGLTDVVAKFIYLSLIAIALWGGFCVAMVWMRVAKQRFRSEESQDEFLSELETPLSNGDFAAAAQLCDGDPRAVAQLSLVAVNSRHLGYAKMKHTVMDRFQRDVLSDLEQRLSWVNTVIKSAPMVGLFGTVIGMMGAFGKLAGASNVSPEVLAKDISVALITTASGLAIAIPLVLVVASINIRIRKMEIWLVPALPASSTPFATPRLPRRLLNRQPFSRPRGAPSHDVARENRASRALRRSDRWKRR